MVVLVLDAELKTMLSVIRSLGKYGVKTIAISNGKIGGYLSKYCWRSLDFSDFPSSSKLEAIGKIIESENVEAVFAHLESTIFSIYDILDKICADVKVIAPTRDVLKFVINKYNILEFAKKLSIKIPNTKIVTLSNLKNEIKDFNFPFFVKTLKELDIPPGPNNRYIVIESRDEIPKLEEFVKKHEKVLVQEYIKGFGCGIGGLFYNGKPVAVGGHRRIREAFKMGGPSTFAVSYINKKALEYALKLMDNLKYSGFGMVEFKATEDGEVYLMELNPRIWGTFPLYVKSGLDLPVLAYKLFVENDKSVLSRNYLEGFVENKKMIFLFEYVKSISQYQISKIQKVREIFKDLLYLIFDTNTKEGLFEWRDPKPFIYLIFKVLKDKFKSI